MYILSNAIKNLFRNKGRNILLAIILFIIILTTAVSIIINSTTSAIIDDYKTRFGSEVFLLLDSKKLNDGAGVKSISSKEYLLFGESDLLQKKVFTGTTSLVMTNIEGVGEGDSDVMQSDFVENLEAVIKQPNALLMGFSDSHINEEFENGLREIVEGKMASNPSEVMISRELAKLNSLSIGSAIRVQKYAPAAIGTPLTDTLIVSGIYQDHNPIQSSYSALTNRSNEIITSLNIFTTLNVNQEENTEGEKPYIRATYYLKDPKMLEAFQNELYEKGLPDYYKVSTDENSYNQIVAPVEVIKNITTIFVIVVMTLGSVVLIMLSTLTIRERKYEVGVLRAMGMKKGKVALGMLSEILVITGVCLVLGLGLGTVVAQPVADALMSSQVTAIEQKEDQEILVVPGDLGEESLEDVKIQLTGSAIVQISFIALMLAGVSSIVGIVFITRYEPMKILSERN